jgi:hypothetical protein
MTKDKYNCFHTHNFHISTSKCCYIIAAAVNIIIVVYLTSSYVNWAYFKGPRVPKKVEFTHERVE